MIKKSSSKFIKQIALVLILSFANCLQDEPTTSSAVLPVINRCGYNFPYDWKKVEADNRFTFMLPNNFVVQDIRGIDSYIGKYRSDDMELTFDYGIYSDSLKRENYKDFYNYKETSFNFHDKAAKLISYEHSWTDLFLSSQYDKEPYLFKYVIAMHIDNVLNKKDIFMVPSLTFYITYKKAKDFDMAMAVLCSIRFIKAE